MTASNKISERLAVPEGHSLHHMLCPHDCPDTCSVLVTRNDATGEAVAVQGDPTHPVTQGFLCNKVNHYLEMVYNDNRVLYPHRRVGPKGPGARFERISWDEALDAITDDFKKTIAEYGPEAVQPFSYSGTMGMIGFWGMDQRFWNKMNAARLEQTICIYAAMWAGLYTYGKTNGPSIDEACKDGAELIILWGANLVTTSVHSIPFIKDAQARGAKVVVIDPRITRTTMMADWHIQPRPGTDGALALGMMKIITDAGLHDQAFLEEQTYGWKEFIEKRLPDYDVTRVAEITGLDEQTITQLAMEYASTKKSYIRANYGLNRHQNGGQMSRCILVLPCFTGAWREKCGGAGFGNLEEMWMQLPMDKLQRGDLGTRNESRVINMIQIGRALADNVGIDGQKLDPPIKSVFVYNADPVNACPNSNNVRKGFMRDDIFVAVHDTFWTDSCQYADIVLPADTQMERTDMGAAYGNYYFSYNEPIIEPLGESIRNTELFRLLADRMGYNDGKDNAFTQSDEDMVRELVDAEHNPLMEGITFDDLKENGWVRASVESDRRNYLMNGWPTPTGKIEIWCDTLVEDYPDQDPMPTYVPEKFGQEDPLRETYPLQVLSNAVHQFIGSTFQQVPRLHAMQSRPTVELNPDDAAARGIVDGDLVRLYNDNGETYCHAVIVEGLIAGVAGTQKQINGSHTKGGRNVNALNSEIVTDFGQGPAFYSALVEVEKVASA